MPRGLGHKAGVDALVDVVRAASRRGVRYLTVFAFSSENWKRPEEEVSGLMGLLLVALSKHLNQLKSEGVRFRVAGDLQPVSGKVRVALHPEVSISVTVNVARSPEEADRQSRGERITTDTDDEYQMPTAEDIFEGDLPQPA